MHVTENIEILSKTKFSRLENKFLLFLIFFCLQIFLIQFSHLNTLSWVLDHHWQFVDRHVLETRPLETLFYLNSQPPLLNLLVLFFSKSPLGLYSTFIIFNAICMSLVCIFIFLLIKAKVNSKLAWFFSLSYCIFPSVLLNVSYPFYMCIASLGFALSFFGFYKSSSRKLLGLLVFCIGLLLLFYTRSSFTLLHVIILMYLFYYFRLRKKVDVRKFVSILLAVFLLCLALPLKNFFQYGFFGTSSWTAQMITYGWRIQQPIGLIPDPKLIVVTYPSLTCDHIHSYLDTQLYRYDGLPNFHSCYEIEYSRTISSRGLSDYSFSRHARSLYAYFFEYLSLPDTYMFLKNRNEIWFYAEFMKIPQLAITIKPFLNGGTYNPRLIIPIVWLYLVFQLRKARDSFMVFSSFLLSLHFLTYFLTDGSESRRYIFEVESIYAVMLALMINTVFNALKPILLKSNATSLHCRN